MCEGKYYKTFNIMPVKFKRQIEFFIYYTLNYTLPDINGVLNNLNISGNF